MKELSGVVIYCYLLTLIVGMAIIIKLLIAGQWLIAILYMIAIDVFLIFGFMICRDHVGYEEKVTIQYKVKFLSVLLAILIIAEIILVYFKNSFV